MWPEVYKKLALNRSSTTKFVSSPRQISPSNRYFTPTARCSLLPQSQRPSLSPTHSTTSTYSFVGNVESWLSAFPANVYEVTKRLIPLINPESANFVSSCQLLTAHIHPRPQSTLRHPGSGCQRLRTYCLASRYPTAHQSRHWGRSYGGSGCGLRRPSRCLCCNHGKR